MRSDDEAGMVTAELAVCLPVLVLLVGAALSLVQVSSAQVRALDAAREAARAAARAVAWGDTAPAVRLAGEVAPGVRVHVTTSGSDVIATATLAVQPIGGLLPSMTITESAVAAREPRDT